MVLKKYAMNIQQYSLTHTHIHLLYIHTQPPFTHWKLQILYDDMTLKRSVTFYFKYFVCVFDDEHSRTVSCQVTNQFLIRISRERTTTTFRLLEVFPWKDAPYKYHCHLPLLLSHYFSLFRIINGTNTTNNRLACWHRL